MDTRANAPDIVVRQLLEMLPGGVDPARQDFAWLQRRAREVYGDVPLAGRAVLEVGAGSGRLCLWAAACGSSPVVGLEPELEGSTSGTVRQFAELVSRTGLEGLTCRATTFQDYDPAGQQFDLVLSYNSVNHLDEAACQALLTSEQARATYRTIFTKMCDLLKVGGYLIVWDVARDNLWPRLGLKNPIDRNIEWDKHQNPRAWQALLGQCGFGEFALTWPVYDPFRPLSRLLGNRWAAYCLGSRFRLQARRMV